MKNTLINNNEIGGNKSNNLKKIIDIGELKDFIIPSFIKIQGGREEEYLNEIISLGNIKLAIRSDSKFEDLEDDSGAGVFETILNVDNNKCSILDAINFIQADAVSKVGEKIDLVVQAMVEEPEFAGTIFGIDSRNSSKSSYTINYGEGLGDKVVDGLESNHVQIVSKNFNNFEEDFISKLITATKNIEKIFNSDLLDIEFAYKNGEIYILQVRPLTALGNDEFENDIFSEKVLSIINNKVKEEDLVLGDMIDINPAELLKDTRSKFLNTLFAKIFPNNSLIEARKDLGYKAPDEKIYSYILNKIYINLEKDLITFLPNNLDEIYIQIFVGYYKKLIKNDNSKQDKLDSIEYPNSIEIVEKILIDEKVGEDDKEIIIDTFNEFFNELDGKFDELYLDYFYKQKDDITNIFGNESGMLQDIDIINIAKFDINELVEKINYLTYSFTRYARGAFYYRNQEEGEMNFYDHYQYNNLLDISHEKFKIPNGFDILDLIDVNFHNDYVEKNDLHIPSKRELFELGRENYKFLFMLLLGELGNKINMFLSENKIDKEGIYNLGIDEFLNNMDDILKIDKYVEKRALRNEGFSKISVPGVITNENLPGNHTLMTSGTYIGHGNCSGDGYYVENSKDLYLEGMLKNIKGKILFLNTATPEIDGILHEVLDNAVGIVTKYGGPGAHIVLRLREENKRRRDKGLSEIGLIVGLGDKFDELKSEEGISINFNKEKLG